MIWFTSDQHYGHRAIIDFCARPFRCEQDMNERLIHRYNGNVRPDDVVYFLGDVSFDNPIVGIPMLKRLMGHRILVRGNHDKWSENQYRQAGFEAVVTEAVIDLAGERVRLSHYPELGADETKHIPERRWFIDRRPPVMKDEFRLCGHIHQQWKSRGRTYNVGVDVNGFGPVSQSVIESWMAKVKKEE